VGKIRGAAPAGSYLPEDGPRLHGLIQMDGDRSVKEVKIFYEVIPALHLDIIRVSVDGIIRSNTDRTRDSVAIDTPHV
jgi:hypothetical protein